MDKRIFGQQKGRSMVDLAAGDQLTGILQGIASGEVNAFYLHLAEGRSNDTRSKGEFTKLKNLNALTEATVVIHGTALDRSQLAELKDAHAKLVWSPQSNLRLYGETTRAKDALDLGLLVGLGADWLPSGSPSLLHEMKVARRELQRQGYPIQDQKLVEMVTVSAAEIAGLDGFLGTLAVGRPADLLVLERRHQDPWTNVVEADPSWVELVVVDGDLSYGRATWMQALAAPDSLQGCEPVIAWGKTMLLDTTYAVAAHGTPPRLATLRADLIAGYPQVGPIFA